LANTTIPGGSFGNGAATVTNLSYSEVGIITLTPAVADGSYLGAGNVSGTASGHVGRFVPHHFDVAASPACGSFSYAGQPFGATVTARNAAGATTLNYAGGFARPVTLSETVALGVGAFSGHAIAAADFGAGVASANPVYAFTAKPTAPQTLGVRATDSDGISSAGHAEATTPLRSGRLRLSNAFGSEKSTLQMPVQAQYWSGQAWLLNAADNCTAVPAAAVARSGYLDHRGTATGAWTTTPSAVAIVGGQGVLALAAPSPSATGSVDVALNLGGAGTDQSCLASHPATTGANLPWLRSQNGACAATWDRDPAARASFGIASPETRRTVHARELF
jgi:MSHA biogenesis protein MshQ